MSSSSSSSSTDKLNKDTRSNDSNQKTDTSPLSMSLSLSCSSAKSVSNGDSPSNIQKHLNENFNIRREEETKRKHSGTIISSNYYSLNLQTDNKLREVDVSSDEQYDNLPSTGFLSQLPTQLNINNKITIADNNEKLNNELTNKMNTPKNKNKNPKYHFKKLFKRKKKLNDCDEISDSFDEDDDDDNDAENNILDNGTKTVPVSRSLEHLKLNVFVYYHFKQESYVKDTLLKLLNKCLTLIPNTKYFLRPQQTSSIMNWTKADVDLAVASGVAVADSNVDSKSMTELTANIIVISDGFTGFPNPASIDIIPEAILKSLNKNSLKNTASFKKYNNNNNNNQSFSGGTGAFSSDSIKYKNNTIMLFRERALKIYINDVDINNNNNNNLNSNSNSTRSTLNQRFMKRLYESSGSKLLMLNDDLTHSNQLTNNIYDTNADSNKLKNQIEQYLDGICRKTGLFSNANFSYIDYSANRKVLQ
jgi:hypothetical protein